MYESLGMGFKRIRRSFKRTRKVSEEQLIPDVFEIMPRMLTGHCNGSDISAGLQVFLEAASLKVSSDFENRSAPEDVAGN